MSHSPFKIKVGAPAAMLLAAAVTTAVSSETIIASPRPFVTWTMNAGTPLAAQSARVFLAKEAANTIRALDLISSAQRHHASAIENDPDTGRVDSPDFRSDHIRSSHQHAAP